MMKKVLIFLLVAGVLMLGTYTIAEEMPEASEHVDFSDGEDFPDPSGDPSPDGGGTGGGPGGVPG